MIFDTSAISALADGSAELARVARGVEPLCLPVIAIGEFRFGALRSRHRARYEAWLDRLIEVSRILAIEVETAQHYAEIREKLRQRGRPIPSNDTWIAALAIQHALPLLSRDRHFDEVKGLSRIAW